MAKHCEFVDLFEQSAAERAQEAHRIQVSAALAPIGRYLTDADVCAMQDTRSNYQREYARHKLWLQRRFERHNILMREKLNSPYMDSSVILERGSIATKFGHPVGISSQLHPMTSSRPGLRRGKLRPGPTTSRRKRDRAAGLIRPRIHTPHHRSSCILLWLPICVDMTLGVLTINAKRNVFLL